MNSWFTNHWLLFFRENYSELLCFEHPITLLYEVVRGTVEEEEDPQASIIRELQEEAEIEEVSIATLKLMDSKVINVDLYNNSESNVEQCYHGFIIKLFDDKFSVIHHKVISNGEDNGHIYKFQWYKYDSKLFAKLNPNTLKFLKEINSNCFRNNKIFF